MTDLEETRAGGCLCGAVRFEAKLSSHNFGACHCEMCRRWTGAALVAATVPAAGIVWKGEAHIRVLQSSDWAERAWCQRCGSGLYYHVTAEGPMAANVEIPVGLFDDASGMELVSEIYVDHRMPGWAIAGEHPRLTRKEILAKFGIAEDAS